MEFSIARDEWFAYQLKRREGEFTEAMPLTAVVASYNLAGQDDTAFDEAELQHWLSCNQPQVGVWCVGVQEIVPLDARGWLASDDERVDRWQARIARHLGADEFVCVAREKLFGLCMWVFVHVMHAPHVHHVATQSIGAGLLGTGGNKGGVAIRFALYNSNVCFVNAHLAAHQGEVAMRNSDFHTIASSLRFNVNAPGHESSSDSANADATDAATPSASHVGSSSLASSSASSIAAIEFAELEHKAASSLLRRYATLTDHDIVIWLGDLNYRIDATLDDIVQAIHAKRYDHLLECDQLRVQQRAGHAFVDFFEQPITFAPTYKFKKGFEKGAQYDNSASKPPAYCDRILYLAAPHAALRPLAYTSVPDCCASDHKPVRAEFEMSLRFSMLEQCERTVDALKRQFDAFEAAVCTALPPHMRPQPECFVPVANADSGMMSFKSHLAAAAHSMSKGSKSMAAAASVLSGDSAFVNERIINERRDEHGSAASTVSGGFMSGLSELFTKPAQGAQNDGVGGFFKGLAQGLGGLIAKPTAGMLDALSHSLHSAAVSACDDLDPELTDAAASAKYSLDGYLRLAWYFQTMQHRHTVPAAVLTASANEVLSSSSLSSTAGVPRTMRAASAFGRQGRASSPSFESSSCLSDALLATDAPDVGGMRVLRGLGENLIVSIKVCDRHSAILVSNHRICVIGVPSQFAPTDLDDARAAARAKKTERARVISIRSASSGGGGGGGGDADSTEASSLHLWLGPPTRECEFRVDAASETLIIQCVVSVAGSDDVYTSHRIACASSAEAHQVAALLTAAVQSTVMLYE